MITPSNSSAPPLRSSIAISRPRPGLFLQDGDPGFSDLLRTCYEPRETTALEQLSSLKRSLRQPDIGDFWYALCNGMADMLGAQYTFVSKRLVHSQDGVMLPPIGRDGSCLNALAWYYNDHREIHGFAKDLQYSAYKCPCAYLQHDKVFIIPERLDDFIVDNPNAHAMAMMPPDAYMGIPLFVDGTCVAHFGFLWTKEGMNNRQLSWGMAETLAHALEDMVLKRILEEHSFPWVPLLQSHTTRNPPVPFPIASLRPYARGLSHELRTPMQGVVGMLDVMYASIVDEASRSGTSTATKSVLHELMQNIEMIQGSSRRAIEAADNVAQAYDLNMGMPFQTPASILTPAASADSTAATSARLPPNPQSLKRRRSAVFRDSPLSRKVRLLDGDSFPAASKVTDAAAEEQSTDYLNAPESIECQCGTQSVDEQAEYGDQNSSQQAWQSTNLFELCRHVVHEAMALDIRIGPTITVDDSRGQTINLLSSGPELSTSRTVSWAIEGAVPDIVSIAGRDLAKALSNVFRNALKFTDVGEIVLGVSVRGSDLQTVAFNIKDTGHGISADFLPKLFDPFTREDRSTTRHQEGLGLGLLVAKGLAQKHGGHVRLISTNIEGEHRGSEFEICMPFAKAESLPKTPFSSAPDPAAAALPTPSSDCKACAAERAVENHETDASTVPASKTSFWAYAPYTQDPNGHQTPPTSPRLDSKAPIPSVLAKVARAIEPPRPATNLPSSVADVANATFAKPTSLHDKSVKEQRIDTNLAKSHPLRFMVVEDNAINRKLLVNMLVKLGYDRTTQILEACDGIDAVQKVVESLGQAKAQSPDDPEHNAVPAKAAVPIDVILMDLWMPSMDGYEATEKILEMYRAQNLAGIPTIPPIPLSSPLVSSAASGLPTSSSKSPASDLGGLSPPTILAVTADATDDAAQKATKVGMNGVVVKPFRLRDLERLVKSGLGRPRVTEVM